MMQEDDLDELLDDCIKYARERGEIEASWLQMKFKIGYCRAGRIMQQMAERGIISDDFKAGRKKVLK